MKSRPGKVAFGTILLLVALLAGCRETRRAGQQGGQSGGGDSRMQPGAGGQGIYDPNPAHVWNRLYRQLYVRAGTDGREYGLDPLDPPLWSETRYLLEEPAFQQTILLTDEFISTRAELLIADRLKRAVLQRDLLAIFEWLSNRGGEQTPQSLELQKRLALIIKRLALTRDEINSLPDNYARAINSKAFAAHFEAAQPDAAFLPPELFQAEGDWVCVGLDDGQPIALSHATVFTGRSVFLVFIRLPEGRAATLSYLRRLYEFAKLWTRDTRDLGQIVLNPDTPQFPVGTQVALVRRTLLVDERGELTPTNLVEDVQLRVYHAIPPGADRISARAQASQYFYEFKLSREKLFAGEAGGLRRVASTDEEFQLFGSQGVDPFEGASSDLHREGPRRVLGTCATCHAAPGIHSVLSLQRRARFVELSPADEVARSLEWKTQQQSWSKLRALLSSL